MIKNLEASIVGYKQESSKQRKVRGMPLCHVYGSVTPHLDLLRRIWDR